MWEYLIYLGEVFRASGHGYWISIYSWFLSSHCSRIPHNTLCLSRILLILNCFIMLERVLRIPKSISKSNISEAECCWEQRCLPFNRKWQFYDELVNRLPICFRHPTRIFQSNGKHPRSWFCQHRSQGLSLKLGGVGNDHDIGRWRLCRKYFIIF